MKQKENLGSFILLAAQPSKLVGDNYIELGSSLHNLLPLSCGHIMCNLSTVGPEVTELGINQPWNITFLNTVNHEVYE